MSKSAKIQALRIRLEQAEQALARAELFETGDVKIFANIVQKLEDKLEALQES